MQRYHAEISEITKRTIYGCLESFLQCKIIVSAKQRLVFFLRQSIHESSGMTLSRSYHNQFTGFSLFSLFHFIFLFAWQHFYGVRCSLIPTWKVNTFVMHPTPPPPSRVAAEMISTNRTAFLPSSMSFNAWQPLLTRPAACLPQLTAGNEAGQWQNNWKSVSCSAGKVKTITIEQSVTTPNERLNCNKLLQKKKEWIEKIAFELKNEESCRTVEFKDLLEMKRCWMAEPSCWLAELLLYIGWFVAWMHNC